MVHKLDTGFSYVVSSGFPGSRWAGNCSCGYQVLSDNLETARVVMAQHCANPDMPAPEPEPEPEEEPEDGTA